MDHVRFQQREDQMRELAILTFVTVDGVLQAPHSPEEDTSNGFAQAGWARPCWDEVMEQVQREAMSDPYDLLLGRRTCEVSCPSTALQVSRRRCKSSFTCGVGAESRATSR